MKYPGFSYIFASLLVPVAVFLFSKAEIWSFGEYSSFYVRIVSIFLMLIGMLLLWYYSGIFTRKIVLDKLFEFGILTTNADLNKISEEDISILSSKAISELKHFETFQLKLYGLAIPLFLVFFATTTVMIRSRSSLFVSILLGCLIITLLTLFIKSIYNICNIEKHRNDFEGLITALSSSTKGIQFFNAQGFIESNFQKVNSSIFEQTKHSISKAVWKSFFYLIVLFSFVLFLYILKIELITEDIFYIDEFEGYYIISIFSFAFALNIYLNYRNNKLIVFTNLKKYQLENSNIENKQLDRNNLFIAFHGVYFQDPSRSLEDSPILKNVSMSVLPGELISIVSDNPNNSSYIFDLLLKYYKPQSGKIYLSGTKIDSVETNHLRSLIGVFRDNFALIPGNIYENISILTNNHQKILAVAEKTGLQDVINEYIFDFDGNIALSQETLLRLQIARIAIKKPPILLVETPKKFENEESQKVFDDFVKHSSKRKTVLIITNDLKTIIYSSKILCLFNGDCLFGTHAELSKYEHYQNFIKNLISIKN